MRFLLFFLIVCFCSCRSKESPDPLTQKITREKARTDFRIFRDILEETHPALTEYVTTQQKNAIFDSLYLSLHEKISLREFYKKLAFLAGKTGCSHTVASLPQHIIDTLYNRRLFFPFPTILLDNDLYINSDHQLDHGTKILSINGLPVKRILDSLMIYNPVEGNARVTQRHAAAGDFGFDYYIHFGVPRQFEVLLKDSSGRISTSFFDPVTLDELSSRIRGRYYYDATDVDYSLFINDALKYALLRLPSFELGSSNRETAFENFLHNSFELLSKKKEIRSLIIDLRENPGGDLYNCFLLHSYLSKNPFPEYTNVFSRVKKIPYTEHLYDQGDPIPVGDINNRLKKEFITKSAMGYSIPDSLIEKWAPHRFRFPGTVYIITNHEVSSAASYFTLLTKKNGRAVVVGTETNGGAYSGNGFKMLEYKLPASGVRFKFPYAKMIYSFNEPKTGRGIIPDYPLPDNYESFLKNQDLQLNYIIDSLISKNR